MRVKNFLRIPLHFYLPVSRPHISTFSDKFYSQLKVNESRYKQCGATPHFSTGQTLLKKILKKR